MSVQGHIESRKFNADAVITAGLGFIAAVFTLLFLVAMFTGPVSAQKAGPTDKKAMQVLQGMSDYLAKADTVSLRARTFFDETHKSGTLED